MSNPSSPPLADTLAGITDMSQARRLLAQWRDQAEQTAAALGRARTNAQVLKQENDELREKLRAVERKLADSPPAAPIRPANGTVVARAPVQSAAPDELALFEVWAEDKGYIVLATRWEGWLARAQLAVQAQWRIAGLGRITNEDDGYLTLQFKDEDAAQQFMNEYHPTVDVRDMPEP